MASDTDCNFPVDNSVVRGLGSFHKTLPHNEFGEVDSSAFTALVAATRGDGSGFALVPKSGATTAAFTNPQAGLAHDQLTRHPAAFSMPPAPGVLSPTTATEMTELYWMALLRDVPLDEFSGHTDVAAAAAELDTRFRDALQDSDPGHFITGTDLPGPAGSLATVDAGSLFRLGLPGECVGPMVSQFFIRPIAFGTQSIDQRQRPYKAHRDYLTRVRGWLHAQNTGLDAAGQSYSRSNEDSTDNFESVTRYVGTMRDLARFVNKDALHQAYFNAALLLLSGGAEWTPGNPYGTDGRLVSREAGFGVLGGPHILALVSEVASRGLKIVWNQKWQVNLRLRPEAYGGLVHMQTIGLPNPDRTRAYGLPPWVAQTQAATRIRAGADKTLLLPMAFTAGSPTHPAYGAGHATVAGICVTVLKAYFKTFVCGRDGKPVPVPFASLTERAEPFGAGQPIVAYSTGVGPAAAERRTPLSATVAEKLTIEGELNKLASNVAMGRSMGGVHWRTDNSRSLVLGEAIAAQILADITVDSAEHPEFTFRTFARCSDGEPKVVVVRQGRIFVNGKQVDSNPSAL
ncbi:MAG: phosphoesterase [Planctomycetaceae bacterium]|nr:phosphoesterase [Planctomycetaceae bacterium]